MLSIFERSGPRASGNVLFKKNPDQTIIMQLNSKGKTIMELNIGFQVFMSSVWSYLYMLFVLISIKSRYQNSTYKNQNWCYQKR